MQQIILQNLGTKDYKETWEYQESLFDGIVQIKRRNRNEDLNLETPNYFLFVEHPHVYTLGKSGNFDNLLLNEAQLAQKDIAFYKINRGGDITYHGYGQIVGYPILDLDNFFNDIHKYMRFLEEVIIRFIEEVFDFSEIFKSLRQLNCFRFKMATLSHFRSKKKPKRL